MSEKSEKERRPSLWGRSSAFYPSLAAATTVVGIAAAGVDGGVATAVAALIDEQQNDDDQQDPVAVTTAEQVTQTHISTPLHCHSMWGQGGW